MFGNNDGNGDAGGKVSVTAKDFMAKYKSE